MRESVLIHGIENDRSRDKSSEYNAAGAVL